MLAGGGVGLFHRGLAHAGAVLGGENGLLRSAGGRLHQKIRKHGDVLLLRHGAKLLQRQRVGLLHHVLLGGQDHLPGLHLGRADKALLPLVGGLGVFRGELPLLALRLGAVAGRDALGLIPGGGEDTVDLRLGIRLDAPGDVFDSVHVAIPFPWDQPLILMIISMDARRDKMA